jgi:hypothetical protein
MVVKVVQLVVVDRNARMGLGLGPDLVVAHGTVVLRILGRAVDVWVMWKALEEADLAGVVYRTSGHDDLVVALILTFFFT